MSAPTHDLGPELVAALSGRLERLRGTWKDIDALLVTSPIDIRYLTGFIGEDSVVLVGRERAWIVSDTRFDESLRPWDSVGGIDVVMGTRHRLDATVAALCATDSIRMLGIDADFMTVTGRRRLEQALEASVVETSGLVAYGRRFKDALEIAATERSVAIQQAALTAALGELRIGMTELEFAARLEFEMKSRGASGSSFSSIVGAGANSSIIHHSPGKTPIGPGPLLVDWGAVCDYYCSDMTRTFAVESMPAKVAEIYDLVLEAQLAAIDACAPGRTCAEIDAVARDVITKAGYGDYFGHGLGHGLGLEVHEAPYFNDLETETRLAPGMIMTVEPGIYLPGVGGVRIEDDVLITERGCRVLNDLPKDPDAVILDVSAGLSGVS